MTTLQKEQLQECIVSDAERLVAMCRRLASRKPPGYARTRLVQISEHLEFLVEQAAEDDGRSEDVPETY